jgi:hypothetical protein
MEFDPVAQQCHSNSGGTDPELESNGLVEAKSVSTPNSSPSKVTKDCCFTDPVALCQDTGCLACLKGGHKLIGLGGGDAALDLAAGYTGSLDSLTGLFERCAVKPLDRLASVRLQQK